MKPEPLSIEELLAGPEDRIDSLSDSDLARLLGITPRTVRTLAQDQIIKRIAPGRFSAPEAVQAYVAFKVASAPRKASSAKHAKEEAEARLKAAQAEAAELKAAALRGELVDAQEVTRTWSAILRDVRAGMLAVPSRVGARLPALTAHDIAEIDAEVRAALEALADGND